MGDLPGVTSYQHTETNEVGTHRFWQNKLDCSFYPDNPPAMLVPYTPSAPVVSLGTRRLQALQQINQHYQVKAEVQIGQYPDFEIQTWLDQEREALEYQAWVNAGSEGLAPATPTLTGIVTARGIELPVLVTRVIANAAAWRQIAPTLAGQRQAWADQVMEAATVEEVGAIITAMLAG